MGSDVRAGGAFVEAYVKNQRLDDGLRAVNQKVRASVTAAKSALGTIGSAGVSTTVTVAAAGVGFLKGFFAPMQRTNESAKQLPTSLERVIGPLTRIENSLKEISRPFIAMNKMWDIFSKGGLKSALLMTTLRSTIKNAFSPEQYAAATGLFDQIFNRARVAQQQVEKLATAKDKVASKKTTTPKPQATRPDRIWIEEHERDGKTVPGHWRKMPTKKSNVIDVDANSSEKVSAVAKAASAAAAATETLKTKATGVKNAIISIAQSSPKSFGELKTLAGQVGSSLSTLGQRVGTTLGQGLAQAAAAGNRNFRAGLQPQSAGAWGATVGRRIAVLFGDSFTGGMFTAARKGARAAEIAAKADGSIWSAAGIWAGRKVHQGLTTSIRAGMGATAGFAIGGPFGAALGAAIVTRPTQSVRTLVGLMGRLTNAARGALGAIVGAKPKKEIDDIGNAADRTSKKISAMAKEGKASTSALSSIGSAGRGISAGWLALTGVAGGALGYISKLSHDAAISSKDAATAMGVTVAQASKLGAAAELGGSSLEAVKSGVQHINESIKSGSDVFARWGVSIDAVKNQSPDQRFASIAAHLRTIENPAQRASAAMDLLGTTDLLPLVNDFDRLGNKAESLGAVLQDADAQAATELRAALAELSVSTRSIGSTLSSVVTPALTAAARYAANWARENKPLLQTLFGVARNVVVVASVMTGLTMVAGKIAPFLPMLSAAFAALTSPIGLVAAGIVALAVVFPQLREQAWAAFGIIKDGVMEIAGPLMESIEAMKQGFTDVFNGIVDALTAGNLGLAAQIASEGLQTAFAYGWAVVHAGFMDFSNGLLDAFDFMSGELRIAGEQMFPGFDAAWVETVGTIMDMWTVGVNFLLAGWDLFVSGVQIGWQYTFGALAKGINWLRSLFNQAFDIKGANQAIDEQFDKKVATLRNANQLRAEARQRSQDETLMNRQKGRDQHYQDVKDKGLRGAIEDENAKAYADRQKETEEAKKRDQDSIKAAREKLKISIDQAKSERQAKDRKLAETITTGAAAAQAGSAQATRKGFEAQDIRSKEGLSAVASTARGNSPLDKQIDLQKNSLAEAKKQTDLQWKQWKQMQAGLVPKFPV